MSKTTTTRLALAAWALIAALALLTLLFASMNASEPFSLDSFAAPLILLATATIGALVASRRPENAIGWIFCATALLNVAGLFAQEYAVYTLVTRPGGSP